MTVKRDSMTAPARAARPRSQGPSLALRRAAVFAAIDLRETCTGAQVAQCLNELRPRRTRSSRASWQAQSATHGIVS